MIRFKKNEPGLLDSIERAGSIDWDVLKLDIKEMLDHVSKEEIKQMTQKTKDFYDEISKSFTSTKIRLLDDENAPKFKRQYSEYPCFIPVHNFNQTSLNYDLYTNVYERYNICL